MLTVVIPFFQRTPGLLARCVKSVLMQDSTWPVQVVVTDDGSPLSAEAEIGDLVRTDPRVRILVQPNSGPGAARNRALDHVAPETTFVGLMDSDDWWEPGFIRAAEIAFADAEVDLFFSDSSRFGQSETRFLWETDPALNLRGADHFCIDAAERIYEFITDYFDFMIRRSSVLGTSSMIYRRSCAPELRFDTTLFNGQDRLFKLHLARRVRRSRFSAQALSSEGEGVNIFDSARWGSNRSLRLSASYVRLGKKIGREFPLTNAQCRFIDDQVTQSRREFIGNVLHLVARGEPLDWSLVRRTIGVDPALLLLAPVEAAKALMRWRKRG